MRRSLIDATIILAIVGLAWLLLRNRISSALANGLFLLVLIKAAVSLVSPLTLTVVVPWPVARPARTSPGIYRPNSNVVAVDPVPPEELASMPLGPSARYLPATAVIETASTRLGRDPRHASVHGVLLTPP